MLLQVPDVFLSLYKHMQTLTYKCINTYIWFEYLHKLCVCCMYKYNECRYSNWICIYLCICMRVYIYSTCIYFCILHRYVCNVCTYMHTEFQPYCYLKLWVLCTAVCFLPIYIPYSYFLWVFSSFVYDSSWSSTSSILSLNKFYEFNGSPDKGFESKRSTSLKDLTLI